MSDITPEHVCGYQLDCPHIGADSIRGILHAKPPTQSTTLDRHPDAASTTTAATSSPPLPISSTVSSAMARRRSLRPISTRRGRRCPRPPNGSTPGAAADWHERHERPASSESLCRTDPTARTSFPRNAKGLDRRPQSCLRNSRRYRDTSFVRLRNQSDLRPAIDVGRVWQRLNQDS